MLGWNLIARKVADHVWQIGSNVSLSRATELWLADNSYDVNSDTVSEGFDHLVELVCKHIQAKIQDCDIRGVKPKYQLSLTSMNHIIAQIDTDEHALRTDFLVAIGKLSWRAFEHLCVHAMNAAGVSKCKATSATRDQGIDFVGVLELKELASSSIWHDVQLRVLGQAKYYSTAVGQEKIRTFSEDMAAFSRGEGHAFKNAPEWAQKKHMPQIGFVFALTGFSQVAKDYAASHSIMLKDVEQMVQDFLSSDIETPGLVHQGQHIEFDENNFLSHFERYK